jgi:hypothetical protein
LTYRTNDRNRFDYVVKQRRELKKYRWAHLFGAVILAPLAVWTMRSPGTTFAAPDWLVGSVFLLLAISSAQNAIRAWGRDIDYEVFVRLCELELQRVETETSKSESPEPPAVVERG